MSRRKRWFQNQSTKTYTAILNGFAFDSKKILCFAMPTCICGRNRRYDAKMPHGTFQKGRPDTFPVSFARIHHRLVVGEPELRLVSQPLDDKAAVARKNFRRILV